MRTPTGSRWMSNNYITRCHISAWESCSWRQWVAVAVRIRVAVPVGERMPAEWEPVQDRGLGPSVTPVEQPSKMSKKCCYGQRNLASICCSLSPSPTHLSHITNMKPIATLSRIKCERYIFLKKCVRSFIEVAIMFRLYLYMYTYSCMWLYNIPFWTSGK